MFAENNVLKMRLQKYRNQLKVLFVLNNVYTFLSKIYKICHVFFYQLSFLYVTIVESDKLQVAYVWEPDEWYYEGEWEAYKADENERKKLEVENEKEAQRKSRLLLAKDHERQLSWMPPMNLFEDDNHDDGEYVTDYEEDETYDYDNAHLAFSSKQDPKFSFYIVKIIYVIMHFKLS